MININYGRNQKLLEACKPLMEYSWLIAEVRKNKKDKEVEIGSAIDKAITEMPNDFVIKPFLEANRAEVKGMLLEEYNEAETMELFRVEGREEGREEGQRGMALNLYRAGIPVENIAQYAEVSVAQVKRWISSDVPEQKPLAG